MGVSPSDARRGGKVGLSRAGVNRLRQRGVKASGAAPEASANIGRNARTVGRQRSSGTDASQLSTPDSVISPKYGGSNPSSVRSWRAASSKARGRVGVARRRAYDHRHGVGEVDAMTLFAIGEDLLGLLVVEAREFEGAARPRGEGRVARVAVGHEGAPARVTANRVRSHGRTSG